MNGVDGVDGVDGVTDLLVLDLVAETDLFLVRQRAREVAVALGLEGPDQVRVATAVSEVGRDLLAAGGARVTFSAAAPGLLVVELAARTRAALPDGGTAAAGRLADDVRVGLDADGRAVVVLTKALPRGATWTADGVREHLLASPASPTAELRSQNRELLVALAEVSSKQEQLEHLNAELEQTNRGVVALYVDLEEKQEQLLEADRAKSRFLTSVSHELRGPVSSVLGLARLLLDPAADPLTPEQREQVQLVSGCAQDLLTLVNDLLDLAKAESGRLEPALEPVDLRALLDDLVASVRPLAGPETALVLDDVDVRVPATVVTDPALVRQVLRNLLTNALKFTERGSVRVSTDVHGARLAVRVQDTGIGIAEADRGRVFEEFFQVPGPWQARVRGSGLGLPHARRLAAVLGGGLRLDSELGRGTSVVVDLPVGDADDDAGAPGPRSAEAAGSDGAGDGGRLDDRLDDGLDDRLALGTVLVADDDPVFRGLLHRELTAVGSAEVLEAADGHEALGVLRERGVGLLFLDLRMPRLDGASVLEHLRTDPALAGVAVVVVTAVEVATLDRAHLAAADAVLAKSELSARALVAAARRALRVANLRAGSGVSGL